MVGNFEHCLLVAVLVGGMAGENGRDVEDDGSLLVGERVLRGGFVGKGIEPVEVKGSVGVEAEAELYRNGPGEGDLDVVLVDGEAQIQQLQLAIVAV